MSDCLLITGVNGYLGRNLAQTLIDAEYTVLGVDLQKRPVLAHPRLIYRQMDIRDQDGMAALFEEFSLRALVHLAALVHVRSSEYGFCDYSRVNYHASDRLFRLAQAHGLGRVIFTSSIEVYGPTRCDGPVGEDSPCHPESDYARAKLLAEEALAGIAEAASISYAVLRLAPVYGPGFRLNFDKRLYVRAPSVGFYFRRGDYRVSLCSIRNIEHFILSWLRSRTSGIFNLADDKTYTVKDLLDLERRHGNAKFVVRFPYWPALLAIAARETGLAIAGRKSGLLSVGNLHKLVRSAVWDTTRARSVVGDLPWTVGNTLYENEVRPRGETENPVLSKPTQALR